MREILFRGKAVTSGEWVYGDLIGVSSDFGGTFIRRKYNDVVRVDPETVGQFTGVYDHHGTRIFEGDLLLAGYKFLLVLYDERTAMFCATSTEIMADVQEGDRLAKQLIYQPEVLGNIHDNLHEWRLGAHYGVEALRQKKEATHEQKDQ